MTYLNFTVELCSSRATSPFKITSFKAVPLRSGRGPSMLSIGDASVMHTNYQSMTTPRPGADGCAYIVFFCLPENFTGGEPMFALLDKIDLPIEELIFECRAAFTTRNARQARMGARRLLQQSRASH